MGSQALDIVTTVYGDEALTNCPALEAFVLRSHAPPPDIRCKEHTFIQHHVQVPTISLHIRAPQPSDIRCKKPHSKANATNLACAVSLLSSWRQCTWSEVILTSGLCGTALQAGCRAMWDGRPVSGCAAWAQQEPTTVISERRTNALRDA